MSPDMASDKFGSAELALFGPSPAVPTAREAEVKAPQGRVLQSLIEAPSPMIEVSEPPRRGRKPGSKNKPKAAPTQPAEVPARPSLDSLSPEARAFAQRPSGRHPPAPTTPTSETLTSQSSPQPVDGPALARGRLRLRERSSIIRRYVLGVEPRPGQAGFRKAKRAAAVT